jgi:hypothetical protein
MRSTQMSDIAMAAGYTRGASTHRSIKPVSAQNWLHLAVLADALPTTYG